MALQDPLLFLGLTLFTLMGFIIKSLSKYSPDSYASVNPVWKMMSQGIFILLIATLWILLIFVNK